jgi:hypothetical protein
MQGYDWLDYAIPDNYFDAIRSSESGGNDAAKNPRSSATGRYQFTKGTWDALMTSHPELGLTPNGRSDPVQQERAIRVFTQQNASQLQQAGLPVNGGDLYAAHFLGATGAKNVLTQPNDTPVSTYVDPKVISANPFLRNMSVGQFKNWTASKGGAGDYPSQRVAQAFASSGGGSAAPFPPAPNSADAMNAAMAARQNMFPAAPSPTQNGPVIYGNLASADFPHSPAAGTAEEFKRLGGGGFGSLGGLGGMRQPGSAIGSNLGTQKERIIDVLQRILGIDNNNNSASGLSNLFPAAPNMPAQSGTAPMFNISPAAMAAVNAGGGGLY